MRGGVTVRAQDLQRLNRDVIGEISEMHPLLTKKLTNTTLRYAVKYYFVSWHSKMAMIRKYGKINDWDVSMVPVYFGRQ